MNITKKELKQLINEVLSETDFNPFKQGGRGIAVKSDATADANAIAQAEFDKLDALKKGKKIAASGSAVASDNYEIDYEKRMKNLIIRRDDFTKKLQEIDIKLNSAGKQLMQYKNADEQLNFLNTQMKPLMAQKEQILDELKEIHLNMVEAWTHVSKKHAATLATLKSK